MHDFLKLLTEYLRLAFSKKVKNDAAAVAIYFKYYNFARVDQTLRVTPAMEAGLADHVGPSKKSFPSSDKAENVLVYVERLRQQAEEFQRSRLLNNFRTDRTPIQSRRRGRSL
jgi:hypothetical protein